VRSSTKGSVSLLCVLMVELEPAAGSGVLRASIPQLPFSCTTSGELDLFGRTDSFSCACGPSPVAGRRIEGSPKPHQPSSVPSALDKVSTSIVSGSSICVSGRWQISPHVGATGKRNATRIVSNRGFFGSSCEFGARGRFLSLCVWDSCLSGSAAWNCHGLIIQ
jgi:hypothetical protein